MNNADIARHGWWLVPLLNTAAAIGTHRTGDFRASLGVIVMRVAFVNGRRGGPRCGRCQLIQVDNNKIPTICLIYAL